jgi:signal transduction histidine kinase
VAIIMVSILLIFIYYQKMISLYRQQQNFINGFTHELKTPLTSLRLYLDTFRMHELPRQDQLKYLDLMITDVTRLGGNVESILELGKIESGPKPLHLNLINMAERAKQFINDELQHFPNVKIEFVELPPSDDRLLIKIAPKHLDVIISNIIKNAVNHNRSQAPKIDIEVRRDGRWALLRFKDNGIGIEKNEQKNIFKKFYQIGKASKGTGLGLYIVSQMSKLYDGKINVTSAGLGAGSTFEVRFPLAKVN